ESTATFSTVTLPNTAPFTIGRNSITQSQYFAGRIAEIKVWNTARTANEIRTLMCRFTQNIVPELVGYYKCDPFHAPVSQPFTLKDESAFGIHGQIYHTGRVYYQQGPPIGDESIFFYGQAATNFKMQLTGQLEDTLTLNQIAGQPQGIHLYRSDTPPN